MKLLAPSHMWSFELSPERIPRAIYIYCIASPLETQHETNPPKTVTDLTVSDQVLMVAVARMLPDARDGSKILVEAKDFT